mmetsp:Transcript_90577/g.156939  ORF Transcript_90577/g.156939 Transcript_90577/m.156939 type:complete len:256 (+) Transcript_90577:743-1510(+)
MPQALDPAPAAPGALDPTHTDLAFNPELQLDADQPQGESLLLHQQGGDPSHRFLPVHLAAVLLRTRQFLVSSERGSDDRSPWQGPELLPGTSGADLSAAPQSKAWNGIRHGAEGLLRGLPASPSVLACARRRAGQYALCVPCACMPVLVCLRRWVVACRVHAPCLFAFHRPGPDVRLQSERSRWLLKGGTTPSEIEGHGWGGAVKLPPCLCVPPICFRVSHPRSPRTELTDAAHWFSQVLFSWTPACPIICIHGL